MMLRNLPQFAIFMPWPHVSGKQLRTAGHGDVIGEGRKETVGSEHRSIRGSNAEETESPLFG